MRRLGWVAATVIGGGMLLASNTGFFLEYSLLGPGDSASGTNWVGIPYNSELQSADDLYVELGGSTTVESVARLDPLTDGNQSYTGLPQDDFPITPGEGLIVKMKSSVEYAFVGSHIPGATITLLGPGDSLSGQNLYAPPYHAQAPTAGAVKDNINRFCDGACVVKIERLIRSTDAVESYVPGISNVDFPVVAGEAYVIQVDRTVEFIPDVVK